MANTAYIRDISALDQLRTAIARFCEDNENQLQAIDSKLQSRIGNLKSLESHFQRKVDFARDELRAAKAFLYSCESDTWEDEEGHTQYPDCSCEKEEEIKCRERLQLAEYNYSSFKREISGLEISIEAYQNPKIKFKTFIQFEKESATGSLGQLIRGANDYLSVSSAFSDGTGNSLVLAESVAQIDPTFILATTVGIAEMMAMTVFSFLGLGGDLFSVSNKTKSGIVTTTFSENGSEFICSELKIEKSGSGNAGKIISVVIPPKLQSEKIGKHLVTNMEAACRANDCKEIYGWTDNNNILFYKGLGYDVRNVIKDAGAEVFKKLDSNYFEFQQNAKAESQKMDNAGYKDAGKQIINPLQILAPGELNDEKFWAQHEKDQRRYIELLEKYESCNAELQNGKLLDDIRKEDPSLALAYDIFHGSEAMQFIKTGDYYQVGGNGRHRVAAAQLYYLQTGKIINIPAYILEKK